MIAQIKIQQNVQFAILVIIQIMKVNVYFVQIYLHAQYVKIVLRNVQSAILDISYQINYVRNVLQSPIVMIVTMKILVQFV